MKKKIVLIQLASIKEREKEKGEMEPPPAQEMICQAEDEKDGIADEW